jgi:GT2 family glycosyltransferase
VELSVVIVSWNTRQLLLDALAAFQPLPFPAEVIVVDNDSADGSADAVEAALPAVRVIRTGANLGFAGGVNVGLRAARAPLILLLNPDTLASPEAVASLVAYARAHPAAGIVGPKVLNRDGSLQASIFRAPSLPNLLLSATFLYQLFPRSPFFNRERYGGRNPAETGPVEAVSGCCFLVRREVIEKIGLLDDGFFMYAEETDFCLRARRAGYEVHYSAAGPIVHFGGESSRQASRRMVVQFRRSLVRFARKHHGPVYAAAVRALLALGLAARLPYWGLRSLRGGEAGKSARQQAGHYLAGLGDLLAVRRLP